jgi:hypothetical protein
MCAAFTAQSRAADAIYSATQTIPVPPASSYEGSGGGDGWAVAMTPTAVYNVFHHASDLQVACHLQSDASECWAPKTITDGSGNDFAISGQPGLQIDQASGHLYVFATRASDATGGVVCIDTTQPASTANPFCGFTALTVVGDAPVASGISNISGPVRVGDRWFAFNYVTGSPAAGTKNQLLCFNVTTGQACASQPFAVDLGGATLSVGEFPAPATAVVAGRVIIPYNSTQLACFDTATNGSCGGSWPVTAAESYAGIYGSAFALMDSVGTITGLCLPTGSDPCFDLNGASVATPAGMTSVISATTGWNGPAFVLGPRVYLANGNGDTVQCFDYTTLASCTNFPKALPTSNYMYTTNTDPQRPTCIWVNADGGTGQIQNFDAYTAGPCGQGPIRVLASSIVVPTKQCEPATYTSLAVADPPRTAYSDGTVAFQDGNASPIPGIADRAIDASGGVSLSGLSLNTALGLPQFLITLNGVSGTPGSVTVRLTWTGVDDPACAKPGTNVTKVEVTPIVVNPCTMDGITCDPLVGTFGWGWRSAGKDFTLGWQYGGKHRYLGNVSQGATNWNDTKTKVHMTKLADGLSPTDKAIVVTDVKTLDGYWGITGFPKPDDCSSCTYHVNGIQLAQDTLDKASDFIKTKVATHEIGHALALRHPIEFKLIVKSVMNQHELPYNKPQQYDIDLLKQLYP